MKYFKNTFCLLMSITLFIGSAADSVFAKETLQIDRKYGLARKVVIDVTPSGIVLNFNSEINSVNLSHLGKIVFHGVDGELCKIETECSSESTPTMLLLRKIPSIDFPDQQPNADGTAMLYVNTTSGLYRFELIPKDDKPEYTKVEIIDDPLPPLLESREQ